MEFQSEVLEQKRDLNTATCHDEKPVDQVHGDEATKNTDWDHGREAVRVNPDRLENSDVMALSVSLFGAVQVKQKLDQQRQANTDAVDDYGGHRDRLHR